MGFSWTLKGVDGVAGGGFRQALLAVRGGGAGQGQAEGGVNAYLGIAPNFGHNSRCLTPVPLELSLVRRLNGRS